MYIYIHNIYIYIYIYIYILLLLLLLLFLFGRVLSSHPDEVFTYNNMALMSLRSHSHVKASMVLTRADIYTQLYKITYTYYFKTYFNGPDEARTRVELLLCLMP